MHDFAHAKTNLTTHSKTRCYDQENMPSVSMPTSQIMQFALQVGNKRRKTAKAVTKSSPAYI